MNIKSNILIHSTILIFFLVFFAFVYKPITQGHYFYGDDYLRIWISPWVENTNHSYVSYAHLIPSEGRPLYLLLNHVIFNKYINSLKSYEAANTVRIIGIIGVGLLAYVLFAIFKANRYRTEHALLLSILICTLPPIQVYLGLIVLNFHVYSFLLSALSFLVLFKAVFKEDSNSVKKANVLIAVPISIILFIASLCIYQPTATAYWALAVIPLIMMKNKGFLKRWYLSFIFYFSTGFISMIVYFMAIKILNLLMNIEIQGRGTLIHGVDQLYERLIWFVKYPLYNALSLWKIIDYTKEVKLFVGIVIFAGILYGISRIVLQIIEEKKGITPLLNLLCRYLLVIILMLLSFISHLATVGSNAYYSNGVVYNAEATFRVLVALEIVVLLLLYWGLMNIAEFIKTIFNLSADMQNKIVTIGLVILTVVASLLANHNVDKYFVRQGINEYRYVKDAIQRYGVSRLSKDSIIYVKPAGRARMKGGGDIASIYSEFYNRSSVGLIARLALYELGVNSDISFVKIRNVDPDTGEPFDENDKRYKRLPEDENILKIDMTKMNIKETYSLVYY